MNKGNFTSSLARIATTEDPHIIAEVNGAAVKLVRGNHRCTRMDTDD